MSYESIGGSPGEDDGKVTTERFIETLQAVAKGCPGAEVVTWRRRTLAETTEITKPPTIAVVFGRIEIS